MYLIVACIIKCNEQSGTKLRNDFQRIEKTCSHELPFIQHTFSPNVRFALNYQGTHPYSDLVQNRDMIYVNVQFKF